MESWISSILLGNTFFVLGQVYLRKSFDKDSDYISTWLFFCDFLRYSYQRMVTTYGYSFGGARAHILYRSKNCKLFLVFKTADRSDRVYHLRKDLLYDVFKGHENEIPDFDVASEEEVFIPPPVMIGRKHSCM